MIELSVALSFKEPGWTPYPRYCLVARVPYSAVRKRMVRTKPRQKDNQPTVASEGKEFLVTPKAQRLISDLQIVLHVSCPQLADYANQLSGPPCPVLEEVVFSEKGSSYNHVHF